MACNWNGMQRNFVGGEHFWARGFYVSIVGQDEEYTHDQEKTRPGGRQATGFAFQLRVRSAAAFRRVKWQIALSGLNKPPPLAVVFDFQILK